jgi:hypothetical protein
VPNAWVGLGKSCKFVRGSLPAEFRQYLRSLDAWFDHLENFRHALAHRIPLYIPPGVIGSKNLELYKWLERRKAKAVRHRNFTRYDQLSAAQNSLLEFVPLMMHSATDNSKRIVFHAQLLSDFNTIYDLGMKMHTTLDSDPDIPSTSARRTSTFSWIIQSVHSLFRQRQQSRAR